MRQLRERVGLIHELGKLRRAEKLLDCRRHRPDIDEVGRHCRIHILQAHALAHNALQPRHANADLVLQQLAHAADAPVAQVVDIIRAANAIVHANKVADRRYDIIRYDMARN